MTLEQLRIFIAVAEREHVTRASESLGLTQSATSAAIAALEGRYATPLFDRIGRGIQLTEVGRNFLEHAKAVVARADAAEIALRDLASLQQGIVSIGASQTVASYWLPGHLVEFRRRYPGLDIRVLVGNTEQVANWVMQGNAHVGLVEGQVDEPMLVEEIVGSDRLVVVVGNAHQWDSTGDGRAILAGLNWVLRERGSGTRSEFERLLRLHDIDPSMLRVMLELPSNEAVRAAVEAGIGATAISNLVVDRSVQLGILRVVYDEFSERAFRLLQHKGRSRTRAVAEFVNTLRRNGKSSLGG